MGLHRLLATLLGSALVCGESLLLFIGFHLAWFASLPRRSLVPTACLPSQFQWYQPQWHKTYQTRAGLHSLSGDQALPASCIF